MQPYLVFLVLMLLSSNESTQAELFWWIAFTKILPDATISLWYRWRKRSVRLSWWSCLLNCVLSLEIFTVLMSDSKLKKRINFSPILFWLKNEVLLKPLVCWFSSLLWEVFPSPQKPISALICVNFNLQYCNSVP